MPAAVRVSVAAAVVCVLVWGAWLTLCAGFSRMISEYAVTAGLPEAASNALSLTPSDPEASYALAVILADAGDPAGAARLYERAVSLRPRDYLLWVELGGARDAAGDAEGAAAAFRAAVRLAPSYAAPRWQLGNTLLRGGLREEALKELRRAAESDPALYPKLIQMVWYAEGKDARGLVRAASPRTPEETLAVVRFLVRNGVAGEGIRILRESGSQLTLESKRTLLADLLAAQDYADAYEVWSEGQAGVAGRGTVADGGFEAEARTDDAGFGWQFAKDASALKFSLDPDSPSEGRRSLKVDYAGNSDPSATAVSQLILVEPGARYRLSFAARTKELVTGGPPFVQVVSAAKGEALASSQPLTPGMTAWQEFSVEFTAPPPPPPLAPQPQQPASSPGAAVRVALKRQPCASSPCPAFGSVWLDAFGLRRL